MPVSSNRKYWAASTGLINSGNGSGREGQLPLLASTVVAATSDWEFFLITMAPYPHREYPHTGHTQHRPPSGTIFCWHSGQTSAGRLDGLAGGVGGARKTVSSFRGLAAVGREPSSAEVVVMFHPRLSLGLVFPVSSRGSTARCRRRGRPTARTHSRLTPRPRGPSQDTSGSG